jgi:predicted MFS family arabinose efflux permease
MPSGFTFDIALAAALVVLGLWEAVVAVRRRERKRILVVVLSLAAAGVLLYLRAPEWWPR